MWANAKRDGRPAEYRWRPLFDAAVWLTPTTGVLCSNAAKTRNPLKFAAVPQTRQQISAVNGHEVITLSGDMEEVLLFMVALWNRADHYIFMLWFVYGRPM